jgi:hypothetical protein
MNQFEKNINWTLESIERKLGSLDDWKTKGHADKILARNREIVTDHLEITLFRWRQGADPSADMEAGLDWADQMLADMKMWPPSLVQLSVTDWGFFQTMAYISGRDLTLPFVVPEPQSVHEVLSLLLVDALHDRPYRDRLDAPLEKIGARKIFALPHKCYCAYFAILDAFDSGEDLTPLIRNAEANYKARARRTGGAGYHGYDLYNPYVVDWQLAALIKKTGWQGESIHRWQWD